MDIEQIANQLAESTFTITVLTTNSEIIAALAPLGMDAVRRMENGRKAA